ncbi:hypothetical protein B0T17DRAFT_482035 [Bombardia bombarda]|uniref:Rhodopsin domain-containing protein n=1 Tax=Bombardia bombarda TaxID=252184 RepID=A0AA39XLU8_9PEZI|nr:hypothetical protein B0T17DRAFT_482035 [Bombardia bombarda]
MSNITSPPPGVTPNFDNPESISGRLIHAAAIWPIVTLPFVTLRLYTSGFILKKWHLDDVLIVIGFAFAIANSVILVMQAHYGGGHHIWDVRQDDLKRFLMLGAIGGSLTYNLATLAAKTSILSFYLRFSLERSFRFTVYFVMVMAAGYSLPTAFCFTFLCVPMASYWDLTIPGVCSVDTYTFYKTCAILNVVTDLIILLLPIWMLWPLRVPRMKKIGVTLILMAGGFVCAVSIVRLVMIDDGDTSQDFTWTYINNFMWYLCELHTGLICACLPCLRAAAKHFFPNFAILGHGWGRDITPNHLYLSFPSNILQDASANKDTQTDSEARTVSNPTMLADGSQLHDRADLTVKEVKVTQQALSPIAAVTQNKPDNI